MITTSFSQCEIDYQLSYDFEDIVDLFLVDVRKVPLLTADEEIQLAKKIENGRVAQELLYNTKSTSKRRQELLSSISEGKSAFDRLVESNSRLVISVAKKYTWTGLPLMDLIQDGHFGLIRAIKKFDYRRGYRFSTYAQWWIWQAISRGISFNGRAIRIPVYLSDGISRFVKIKSHLTNELGRQPNLDEISCAMGVSPKKLETIIQASQKIRSLDASVTDDSDSTLGDYIQDDSISIEDVVSNHEMKALIEEGLSKLSPRESKVLRMLYGLDTGETQNLATVGERIGVSRERVRQIQQQAIENFRKWGLNKGLDDFLF